MQHNNMVLLVRKALAEKGVCTKLEFERVRDKEWRERERERERERALLV
jgi:hypothetical protein